MVGTSQLHLNPRGPQWRSGGWGRAGLQTESHINKDSKCRHWPQQELRTWSTVEDVCWGCLDGLVEIRGSLINFNSVRGTGKQLLVLACLWYLQLSELMAFFAGKFPQFYILNVIWADESRSYFYLTKNHFIIPRANEITTSWIINSENFFKVFSME